MNSPNKTFATIILVRGLPGSGKTYLATELQRVLGNDVIMLDPDATDYTSQAYLAHTVALTEEDVDAALHPYRFLRGQAYDGIAAGKTVIWNQPFTNLEIFNKMVGRLQEHADVNNVTLRILVVEVNLDPAIAKQRVEARKQQGGHGPSDKTFERFVNDYRSFAEHGYGTVAVKGDDIEAGVSAVLAKLNRDS